MDDFERGSEQGESVFRSALDENGTSSVFVGESNHRIANNLSIIGGLVQRQAREMAQETRSFTGSEVAQLLREVSQRIDMVGRFHRLLAEPGDGGSIDLGDYLSDVAGAAIGCMARDGEVTLEPIKNDPCEIEASQALYVGFIIGEMVTNAVKYAYPAETKGSIRLSCSRVDGGTRVTLKDHGVGLPDGFDPQSSDGMGLRMTRSLARQLKARLSFRSSDRGLTVELLVPRQAERTVKAPGMGLGLSLDAAG